MITKDFTDIYNNVHKGKPAYYRATVKDNVYSRKFIPEERLILFGAGHIAQPTCEMAHMLDFKVSVVDDRIAFANKERFPNASEILCMPFEDTVKQLGIRDTDYVCIMTRGHQYDGFIIRRILEGEIPEFLGMVGSRRRIHGLKNALLQEGYKEDDVNKLIAPLGIKINSVTVPEIAVSICAQLVQHRRSKPEVEETILEQTNVDENLVDFLASGQKGSVMMVLSTKGSTPVKSGAIMAIDAGGKTYGTIGGGCSEADIMGYARRIIGTGKSRTVDVDMTNEVAAEEGMACGGTMNVLIEDITTD